MSNSQVLLVQKWWDFDSALTAKVRSKVDEQWISGYLKISYKPQDYGVFLEGSRFVGEPKNSNIQAFLRKSFEKFSITHISKPQPNDYQIHGVQNERRIAFLLNKSSPPQLEIIIDGISQFRISSKNCYTKKIPFKEKLDNNLFPNILQTFVNKRIKDSTKNTGSQELHSIQQIENSSDQQNFRKKQLISKKKSTFNKVKKSEQAALQTNQQTKEIQSELKVLESGTLPSTGKYIDPKLNLGKNIDKLHQQIKKQQRSIASNKKQIDIYIKDLEQIAKDLTKIEENKLSDDELQKITQRYKLQSPQKASQSPKKPADKSNLSYQIGQLNVQVGKSASHNDEITKKAQANFVWLHVNGKTGSHVIIQSPEKNISKDQLRKASILALHYSKVSKDFQGEICITAKKNLKKAKGMPPGKWLIQQARYQYIKYSEEELKEVLGLRIYE